MIGTENVSANMQNSLPDDIALKIVSFLQVSDVCALGSCSRFWRGLCDSDYIWVSLSRERWPSLLMDGSSVDFESSIPKSSKAGQSHQFTDHFSSGTGWKVFYINRHSEVNNRTASIVKFVEQCSSSDALEVGDYLKAIGDLSSLELEFKDVQMFLLSSKQNVLLNLIGLHYSIFRLGIQANHVNEALWSSNIAERKVCVKWWKLGRWFHGFRLRDESLSRRVCLGDLTMAKDEEVLRVLHRGAIHEVLRVQISVADPKRIPWAYENMHIHDY